jgi:hypothetical protein
MLNGASKFVGRPEGELQWQADICRTIIVRLVRDSGRVLKGAPQFVDRPEGELQWQADVCRVR